MNRKKPKLRCTCDFCAAISKQINRDMLYSEGGFKFDFILASLTWRDQVAIGKVRELYPMPMNGSTVFLVEAAKADYITTASADQVAAITKSSWQYVTCHNS